MILNDVFLSVGRFKLKPVESCVESAWFNA